MIDRMLEDNDRNRDGFIDYQEYALVKNHHWVATTAARWQHSAATRFHTDMLLR